MPGIDLVLPDFEYIRTTPTASRRSCSRTGTRTTSARSRTCCARSPACPCTARRSRSSCSKGKLEEHEVADRCELRTAVRRARALRSGRSRCGSCASPTRSPTGWPWRSTRRYGAILHTGDFKIDQTPIDGRPTDLHGLAEEARGTGVHLLLSDSTNAEEAGLHDERADASGRCCASIVANAPGIVVAACFSSHIHRDAAGRDAARGDGRVVAFLGRSMQNRVGGGAAPRLPAGRRPRRDRHRRGRPTRPRAGSS